MVRNQYRNIPELRIKQREQIGLEMQVVAYRTVVAKDRFQRCGVDEVFKVFGCMGSIYGGNWSTILLLLLRKHVSVAVSNVIHGDWDDAGLLLQTITSA